TSRVNASYVLMLNKACVVSQPYAEVIFAHKGRGTRIFTMFQCFSPNLPVLEDYFTGPISFVFRKRNKEGYKKLDSEDLSHPGTKTTLAHKSATRNTCIPIT
ncbi:hypothetical protein ACJX0J_018512, partial [Zea mays]